MLMQYETLVGQVGAEGVTCLMALAIESPQPLSDLAALIKREARRARAVLERCMRYGYVGPVAPLDFTKWHITTKGREILGAFFRLFLGSGSDPVQLAYGAAGSDPATREVDGLARAARAPIIHSDHDRDLDQIHDSELNDGARAARAPRDLQAVAAELDRQGIRDFPGKPNRTALLSDEWVTAERIRAAVTRARNNPLRKSPNPLGLAVAELLKHRPEIDEMVVHDVDAPTEQPERDDDGGPIVATDHPMAEWWSVAKRELALEMTRLTFETWVTKSECVDYAADTYVIALPNRDAVMWMAERFTSTCERILSGINGERRRIRFVAWKEWTRQHSTN